MKKISAVSLIVLLFTGMVVIHPAFAHDFVKDPNASVITKIQAFKVESKLIASNISNATLAQWHVSKSQEYWGNNETEIMSQKDSNLASQISTSISDLYSLVGKQNVDSAAANQKADAVNKLLDQAESEEVSSSSLNNSTIQALAVVGILAEVLEDYGNAIGSKVDLTNMNNMNMNMSTSGGNMQGMSGMQATPIVNMAAYQSSQALTSTAQSMFNNLQSVAPSSTMPYLNKVGTALTELKQKIDAQGSGNDVMTVVHMQIHPNLISAFNIEAVPEFPMPVLLIMISFVGIIVMSRIFYRK